MQFFTVYKGTLMSNNNVTAQVSINTYQSLFYNISPKNPKAVIMIPTLEMRKGRLRRFVKEMSLCHTAYQWQFWVLN